MDYPRNQLEFEKRFCTEETCRDYLLNLRWPDGFCCPKCGSGEVWLKTRHRITCATCKYEGSVLAGSIFHKSHLSLELWFRAAWWMTNQKNGVSALGFQRTFEIGSYRTAWTVLQKLRNAMVGRDRKPLTGEVEVDETLLGGKRSGKRGRGAEGKELVLIAAEINGNKTGRVRIQRVPDASGETLEKFIKANIEGGSVVITDGWRGYNGVKKMGYRHERVVGDSLGKDEVLPRVHRVASLLKRWLLGTHHGRVEVKHLDRYLGEFNFRFNRRTSRSRGLLFYRLLQNAVQIEPEGYREIVDS